MCAVAVLAGTQFGFSPRDYHQLGQANIRLSTVIDDDIVTVEATFGVRDWSNNFDDDYDGTIQFILLAKLTYPSRNKKREQLRQSEEMLLLNDDLISVTSAIAIHRYTTNIL